MDKLKQAGMRSNRAEIVSSALRANMRRERDLPIALALQPVAALAWAVVDGLSDEQELFEAAVEAQEKLALQVGAFAERGLLGQIISECAPDEDDTDGEGDADPGADEGADEAPSLEAPDEQEVA